MADKDMSKTNEQNQTMQHERAKAEVSGDTQREQGGLDRERQEKSAIGGQTSGRNEDLAKDKSRSETSGQR